MRQLARYRGALLGLAVGDALGTTLEFQSPGTYAPLTDLVGGGPFGLQAGQWTDDTSLALCLAESLVACADFDPRDQMARYVRWWRTGYLSSTGHCFDIGGTTRRALARFKQTGEPYSGSTDPSHAGNGSLMRLAAVALRYARRPQEAIARAADSSRTTHGATTAIDTCRYLAGLIIGALDGTDKATLLAERYCPVPGLWDEMPLTAEVDAVAAGSFRQKEPPDIQGSGYVVRSLEAALWAFHRSDSFSQGALLAVNLGDDADTTGAVYGERAIPQAWRKRLALREYICSLATQLYEQAEADTPDPSPPLGSSSVYQKGEKPCPPLHRTSPRASGC